jgi:hypothetical protein
MGPGCRSPDLLRRFSPALAILDRPRFALFRLGFGLRASGYG